MQFFVSIRKLDCIAYVVIKLEAWHSRSLVIQKTGGGDDIQPITRQYCMGSIIYFETS
jgi:hypothetical protein